MSLETSPTVTQYVDPLGLFQIWGLLVLPVGLSVGWRHASLQTTATSQHGQPAVSSHNNNEALYCSDTIDVDPGESPEPAKSWRGRYRPVREDPLSCMAVALKMGEIRKAAVCISNLDSRSIAEQES